MYLVFSVFTSRPTSLLVSIKVSVILYGIYVYYRPVDSRRQHRPAADIHIPFNFSPT
jgi:hypothetical protein